MESGKRPKPMWTSPQNDTPDLPQVKLFNSLTNEKDEFRPNVGKHIEWYSCGPTVYDTSHMGHARAYISIDILRRVMKDYFKFDVHYVMNITDIDDKIIKRARQNYLFENYLREERSPKETSVDVSRALEHIKAKLAKETDEDRKKMLIKDVASVTQVVAVGPMVTKDQLVGIKDQLSDLLDGEKGHSVVDNRIFEELPRYFEADFMADMASLNVLPPDDLTRVSEYVDQIVDFVERIIERGLAYETNGSVYFDTEKFDGCDKHYYAKLVPNAYGNATLLREGEGALTNFDAGEKRAETDFALWKCSKPGEPSWASPWGRGRPGWHIECSAMAGDKCGERLDIHTGGVDLKFPHHDNELAQSEARFSCTQWVNYFLHTGHLTISGCKMSKSLKNFVTIKDALRTHSARQLRLMFLLHSWKDTLDYSADTMTAALSYEKLVLDFFFNVEHACKSQRNVATQPAHDEQLDEKLALCRVRVRDALADSVDTRDALGALKELIGAATSIYAKSGVTKSSSDQLKRVAVFVSDILRMLGAADDCVDYGLVRYTDGDLGRIMTDSIGVARHFVASIRALQDVASQDCVSQLIRDFTDQSRTSAQIDIDGDRDTVTTTTRQRLDSFLDCLAEFRQSIRKHAISNKWRQFLSACDAVRDTQLAAIGVRLQDTDEGTSAIGLMPAWAATTAATQPAKVATQKTTPPPQKKKIDGSVDPKRMFQTGPHEGLFSLFDGDGLPTHDSAGVELSKTKRSKLKKLLDAQQKSFDKHNNH